MFFFISIGEIVFGSKILSSCCDKYQNFDYECSSYPRNDFGRSWTFFELFVLAQDFSLGHDFFLRKISSLYTISRVVGDFFHDIKI